MGLSILALTTSSRTTTIFEFLVQPLLAFLRKIPLIGWLVFALAALGLLLLRAKRKSALYKARASATKRALVVQRELNAIHRNAELDREDAVENASNRLAKHIEKLAVVEDKIELLQGKKLSDELNAYFGKAGS